MANADDIGHDMKDGELDRVIDEVARHLTEGGPGAQFTPQLLARIEHQAYGWRRDGPRSIWALTPMTLAPLAAAGVIVIAALVVWSGYGRVRSDIHLGGGVPQSASGQTAPSAVGREIVPAQEASAQKSVVAVGKPSFPQRAPRPRTEAAVAGAPENMSVAAFPFTLAPIAPPPLDPPQSIAPPALGIDSIDVPALQPVDQIAVQELAPAVSIEMAPIH